MPSTTRIRQLHRDRHEAPVVGICCPFDRHWLYDSLSDASYSSSTLLIPILILKIIHLQRDRRKTDPSAAPLQTKGRICIRVLKDEENPWTPPVAPRESAGCSTRSTAARPTTPRTRRYGIHTPCHSSSSPRATRSRVRANRPAKCIEAPKRLP